MKKKLRESAERAYFTIRNSWPVWYYLLNARPRSRYARSAKPLAATQERIHQDLARDGIAFTTLEALFPGEGTLAALDGWIANHQDDTEVISKKTFLQAYWNDSFTFSRSNPFHALSIRKEILDVVNAYDRMFRRLNYVHLAKTIPVGTAAPAFSQRWHRDPEEQRMVKVFVYLSDVDAEAGPFTFLKGSHRGAPKYGSLFPQQPPLGRYPDETALMSRVDASDIVEAVGAKGTVIFCDTAGIHRGGYARSKERVMLTAFYPSAWWSEKTWYTVDEDTARSVTDHEARFALGLG